MKEVFKITDRDRRQEIIDAVENNREYIAQQIGGDSVDFFSLTTGFILLKKEKPVNLKMKRTMKVKNLGILTLRADYALREIYYTMRNKPILRVPFEGSKDLYRNVMNTLNDLEIMCDVRRETFTLGNFPKGQMFYGHSYTFGDPQIPVGMTENLARRALDEWEITHAQSIIQLEKQAAVTRLIEMGFSKLTNSLLTTTGGNFTRAVYALANRFHQKKHMLFFCDGDAFGNDMLRAIEYGTIKSRHLTPIQAFPQNENPLIHIAGLFPSVAERLNIENDIEEKRPMTNPKVRKRIEFLIRHNLIDTRDLETWKRDRTYELEALSTQYEDKSNNPVGLGIYLVEFMRLEGIPLKPQPPDDDTELLDDFDEAARDDLEHEIREEITSKAPIERLKEHIESRFKKVIDKLVEKTFDDYIDEFINEYVKLVTPEQIRDKVAAQYQNNPRREIYDLRELIDEMKSTLEIEIKWNIDELEKKIEDAVSEYTKELPEDLQEIIEEDLEFQELPEPESELKSFYDVVEEKIGADPADCQAVREALEWRLN